MFEYIGNRDLLNLPKKAFLASSNIPTEMVLPCFDWATRVSRSDECVVSGFSSHLEQRVLHFLSKGTCPIILVLARQLYKKIPEKLQPLLDAGRLLIISASNSPRQTRASAAARNRYVCELADEIVFVGIHEASSLAPLQKEFSSKTIKI